MVVMHLIVDVRDAMGANTVNTMAESVSPLVEQITGGSVRLRILSNLADLRLARARVRLTPQTLATAERSGEEIIEGVLDAYTFAAIDPYRAATHNKGIMNGIDPVIVATGNDWRAVEAGAHAYASRNGRYTSLTTWEKDSTGALVGTIELPMPVGLVGGATKTHPLARLALKIMNVKSAQELGEIAAAVGLAQNLGALRALATEGIQRGHMALHARNIALVAGAVGDEVEQVAKRLAAGTMCAPTARWKCWPSCARPEPQGCGAPAAPPGRRSRGSVGRSGVCFLRRYTQSLSMHTFVHHAKPNSLMQVLKHRGPRTTTIRPRPQPAAGPEDQRVFTMFPRQSAENFKRLLYSPANTLQTNTLLNIIEDFYCVLFFNTNKLNSSLQL